MPLYTSGATADPDMVEGPASATDNAIVRFDGTTGKLTQNSVATLSDTGLLTSAQGRLGSCRMEEEYIGYYETSAQGGNDRAILLNASDTPFIYLRAAGKVGFTSSANSADVGVSPDTYIAREAAAVLGVRNSGSVFASVKALGYQVDAGNVNAQTGTSYTLLSSDNGKVVTCNNASAITVTVPSGLGAGFSCDVIQLGAGQVTFATSSTTINPSGTLKISAQHGRASLYAYAADTFNLAGNISA